MNSDRHFFIKSLTSYTVRLFNGRSSAIEAKTPSGPSVAGGSSSYGLRPTQLEEGLRDIESCLNANPESLDHPGFTPGSVFWRIEFGLPSPGSEGGISIWLGGMLSRADHPGAGFVQSGAVGGR